MVRNAELEQAILDERDDPAPYRVYADWLESRGDPRGELIALQQQVDAGDSPDGDMMVLTSNYLTSPPELVPQLSAMDGRSPRNPPNRGICPRSGASRGSCASTGPRRLLHFGRRRCRRSARSC